MHYTGMAAASYTLRHADGPVSCRKHLHTGTAGIAAVTFIVLGLALLTSWVDRRFATQALEVQEEKLEQSEAYLAEAQRLSHTGSFGWRVSTGDIIWSEESFRIFQYEPNDETDRGTYSPTGSSGRRNPRATDIERAAQDGKDLI